MNKALKNICAILVVCCLVLCSVGAAPAAWGWLGLGNSAAISEEQQGKSTPALDTQNKELTSSENISADVVVVKKSDLVSAINEFKAAEDAGKRSKALIEESEAYAKNVAVTAYDQLMRTRFIVKGLCGYNLETGFDFGIGFGMIIKDFILIDVDVTKANGFNDFGNYNSYSARAGIGIVF